METTMIGRRAWLREAAAGGVAAWIGGGAWGLARLASGQTEPSAKGRKAGRYTVRRPVLPDRNSPVRARPGSRPSPVRPDDRLNRSLGPILDARHLPGMIGAIVRGDSLAVIGSVGVRRVGSSEPIQVTDQVHLGSCTKAMTATLIGILVDDRLLSWNTKVCDVFAEQASRFDPQHQATTLSHLLTHRAGLPHDAAWWQLPGRTTTDRRRAALLRLLASAPQTKPGTAYFYSNAGCVLAGLMAEEVTGQSWEELMQQHLFDPLAMGSAGFGPPGG